MLKKLSILAGILVVLILLFNYLIMPIYVKHSRTVIVPNVIGMNFMEAKKILEDAGLDVKQGDIRYDETKPIGLVIDQNPQNQQEVKSGRRVYLTITGGEQLVDVPKLTGRTLRDAKFALEQRSLQIGEIAKKFSHEFAEDVVISQVIQPGSKVKKSTKIDLIVSNGPLLGNIIVPNFVGRNIDEVKKTIIEKKLKLGKITYQQSDQPPGQILDQYPKKDKSAKEDTSVDLVVAKKKTITEKPVEESTNEIIQEEIPTKPKEPVKENKKTEDKEKKETEGQDKINKNNNDKPN
ncbi:MAG: PASTA domain-containing protein [Ignavibacteria bacterium]|nr:PASTA domain-containing protein [Ignavibacteria bacterium]